MVKYVSRYPLKKSLPDSSVAFSISYEVRSNKLGDTLTVFRVEWLDENNTSLYYCFNSFSAVVDFVNSNFILNA